MSRSQQKCIQPNTAQLTLVHAGWCGPSIGLVLCTLRQSESLHMYVVKVVTCRVEHASRSFGEAAPTFRTVSFYRSPSQPWSRASEPSGPDGGRCATNHASLPAIIIISIKSCCPECGRCCQVQVQQVLQSVGWVPRVVCAPPPCATFASRSVSPSELNSL